MRRAAFSLTTLFTAFLAISSACAAPTPLPAPTLASFVLTSGAFSEGTNIPSKFTCTGINTSPPLKWIGAPNNTRSLVLIADDPDAPLATFTHWVVYDIPAAQTEIPDGAKNLGKPGKNGAAALEYMGPCPPFGAHRYQFALYAIDVDSLGLGDGADRASVERAMTGHIIAKTQLMGRYSK